jgi:hypothetical protein
MARLTTKVNSGITAPYSDRPGDGNYITVSPPADKRLTQVRRSADYAKSNAVTNLGILDCPLYSDDDGADFLGVIMFRSIKPDDDIAIMPASDSSIDEVLEIVSVKHAGDVFIQLVDGRMYSSIGGKSLLAKDVTYIVAATAAHRQALQNKEAIQ